MIKKKEPLWFRILETTVVYTAGAFVYIGSIGDEPTEYKENYYESKKTRESKCKDKHEEQETIQQKG